MIKTMKFFILSASLVLTTNAGAKGGQILPDVPDSGKTTKAAQGGRIMPDTQDSITTTAKGRGGQIMPDSVPDTQTRGGQIVPENSASGSGQGSGANVGKDVKKTNADYQQGIACQKAQDDIAHRYESRLSSMDSINAAASTNKEMFQELEKLIDQGICPESMRADVRTMIEQSETTRQGVNGGTGQ